MLDYPTLGPSFCLILKTLSPSLELTHTLSLCHREPPSASPLLCARNRATTNILCSLMLWAFYWYPCMCDQWSGTGQARELWVPISRLMWGSWTQTYNFTFFTFFFMVIGDWIRVGARRFNPYISLCMLPKFRLGNPTKSQWICDWWCMDSPRTDSR